MCAAVSSDPSAELLVSAQRLRAGDRRQLAKAITLAESTRAEHRRACNELLDTVLPDTGEAIRIGISGLPGVGKSTFIETLGCHLCRNHRRVAVLSVDPSSPLNGGSILGDKTRMAELATQPNAYIRPSPSGSAAGGVASATREAVLLCEAAGFDTILIETVGVGQCETAVADLSDLFLLLLLPATGDQLQGIKRGALERADLVLINKADGELLPQARQTLADYRSALQLLRRDGEQAIESVLMLSSLNERDVRSIWQALAARWQRDKNSGALAQRRDEQRQYWLAHSLNEAIFHYATTRLNKAFPMQSLRQRAIKGEVSIGSAIQSIMEEIDRGVPRKTAFFA